MMGDHKESQKPKDTLMRWFALPLLIIFGLGYSYIYVMDVVNGKGYGIPDNIVHPPVPTKRSGYEVIFPTEVGLNKPDKKTFYYLSEKRQVIYRFGPDRYLELQGENCSGLIWYIDKSAGVKTRIENLYFTESRLPKFIYLNPGKNYVGIPTDDLSFIAYSIDGGKNFTTGNISFHSAILSTGAKAVRYIGVDGPDFVRDVTEEFTAQGVYVDERNRIFRSSGSTGYIEMSDGDIIFGRSNNYYHDWARGELNNLYSRSQYYFSKRDLKTNEGRGVYFFPPKAFIESITMPAAEPYQGWDHIRCVAGDER